MAFVAGTVIAVLFLDGVARYVVIGAVALIETAEIALWLRWRRVASTTGIEAMVGMTGVAITDCAPQGEIRVKGQIWKASSNEPVEAGENVRIEAVDGLRLRVARLV